MLHDIQWISAGSLNKHASGVCSPEQLRPTQPRLQRSGFGGLRTRFVHEWNVLGCEDSSDIADHDAGNAFNRFLGLVVYPREDRETSLRGVVISRVISRQRAGLAVLTFAARDSQTKGSVAQEWDAIDEVVICPGSACLAGGVQFDPTPDIVHI